jgi:hypothetical protein
MLRERALKVVLVLLGLGFCAGIYPIADALWHPDAAEAYGDYMMVSLYVTLGVFLLIAARHPSSHRSLIAFTAWSSFAHALVMGTMGFQFAKERVGFLWGSAVLVVIGVVLTLLAPAKASDASQLKDHNAQSENLLRAGSSKSC